MPKTVTRPATLEEEVQEIVRELNESLPDEFEARSSGSGDKLIWITIKGPNLWGSRSEIFCLQLTRATLSEWRDQFRILGVNELDGTPLDDLEGDQPMIHWGTHDPFNMGYWSLKEPRDLVIEVLEYVQEEGVRVSQFARRTKEAMSSWSR